MKLTIVNQDRKKVQVQTKASQPKWQRIVLLIVLSYETLGCLFGGSLLVGSPDRRFMDMPVEIMHGIGEIRTCLIVISSQKEYLT